MRNKHLISHCFAAIATAAVLVSGIVGSQPSAYALSEANLEALSQTESAGGCKWKKFDCPGWFNGDYEACLSNGDGNPCTCGQVTRECKD